MGARPNPERKSEVLAGFVDYILQYGMADLSLRPAAAALGTSPRMLLYHFGSKEKLIVAAIAEARSREVAMFVREGRLRGQRSPGAVFWRVWSWYAARRRRPYLRLFFEVYGLALQNPKRFPAFLQAVGSDFLSFTEQALVENGFDRGEARMLGTLHLATIRGLLLDLLTTGDRTRTDAVARLIAESLERQVRRVRRRSSGRLRAVATR